MLNGCINTDDISGLTRAFLFPANVQDINYSTENWNLPSPPMVIANSRIDLVATSDDEPETLRLLMSSGRIVGLEFEDSDDAQYFKAILNQTMVRS